MNFLVKYHHPFLTFCHNRVSCIKGMDALLADLQKFIRKLNLIEKAFQRLKTTNHFKPLGTCHLPVPMKMSRNAPTVMPIMVWGSCSWGKGAFLPCREVALTSFSTSFEMTSEAISLLDGMARNSSFSVA